MKIRTNQILAVGTLALALMAVGCGKQNTQSLVQGIQLNSHQDNGDTFVGMTAQLNTGAMQLVAFDLTIVDPKNPTQAYGHLSAQQLISGGAQLSLDVNLTKVTHLNYVTGVLPNGTPIPVTILGGSVIGIPIGNTGGYVYVAYGNGAAMLGVAMPIKEFNGMSGYVGTANIFPAFDFGKGVTGVGGVFVGNQPSQSGIAIFVDASGAIPTDSPWTVPGASKSLAKASLKASDASSAPATIRFQVPTVSQKQKSAVNSQILKLHNKRAKLHF